MSSFLEKLGPKYFPGKILHGYLPIYAQYFEKRRHLIKNICEIGVQKENCLNMWKEYFPNAKIYGVDINPEMKKFESDRIQILIGDQGNKKFLETIPNNMDIIIDDGSHSEEHQILGFKTLVPKMSRNGIYAVEDIYSEERESVSLSFFKTLVNSINYWPKGVKSYEWPTITSFENIDDWMIKDIVGVSFYRYLVLIFKGKNPESGEAHFRLQKENFLVDNKID